jgi:hypothetical protein
VSAWKDLERRVCRALGSQRRGQVRGTGWAQGSDNDETGPFSIETKRTQRYSLRRAWIEQARRNAKADGRPWLLVISEHNDRRPLAVLDFWEFAKLAQDAGWIGKVKIHGPLGRLERLTAATDPDSSIDVDEHVSHVVARLEEMRLK